MTPTADNDEQTAAVRSVVTAFTVLGALGQAFALPAMIVGAFAGPHLLIPAVAMFAVGIATIFVGRGVSCGAHWAHVAGAMLAAAIAAASVWWAAALMFHTEEPWPVRFFLGLLALALGAPFAAAAVALVKKWSVNPAD